MEKDASPELHLQTELSIPYAEKINKVIVTSRKQTTFELALGTSNGLFFGEVVKQKFTSIAEMFLMHMNVCQVVRLTKNRFLAGTPGTAILGAESGGVYIIDRKKP